MSQSVIPNFPGVVCPEQAACKCCGAAAPLYGLVDFNRSCEDGRRRAFVPCGVPIYYHRCGRCGLLFTTALDGFGPEDFRSWVYNKEYALVDPDYADARPQASAAFLSQLFRQGRPRRLLDYGCGSGRLAELLLGLGFEEVACYDPFVPAFATRPQGHFDCVCAFEVAEHSTDPLGTFADLAGFLAQGGMAVFSTVVQPADFERQGLSWWYVGPRNGHVSLFSRDSLRVLAERLGLRFASFDDVVHVLLQPEQAQPTPAPS